MHPAFRRFSEASVASVALGSASPLRDALGPVPSAEEIEVAAFAPSSHGLAPLLATLPDLSLLPPDLPRFFASERRSSAVRADALKTTLCETASDLGRAGISFVALKGATLAFRDYGEAGLRPMGDLDLLLFDPGQQESATQRLLSSGWRLAYETTRHRVFVRPDERAERPSCEDARNPIHIELHREFRIRLLGRSFDATPELLSTAERHTLDGQELFLAAGEGLRRHLLLHAAGDFAASGLRGVQAYDFRFLSRRDGPLTVAITERDRRSGLAPLCYAAEAVERLFPGSFSTPFLGELRAATAERFRSFAATLPPLRHTRPLRGWTGTLLSLIESPVPRGRFLLGTLFPTTDEVKINAAPDASGAAVVWVWLKVFGRRLLSGARFLLGR